MLIRRAILLLIGVIVLSWVAVPLAHALDFADCTIPKTPDLCMTGDVSCITGGEAETIRLAGASPVYEAAIATPGLCMAGDKSCPTGVQPGTLKWAALGNEQPKLNGNIPNGKLSLYKTVSYVTGATLSDQIWYLIIASEAATTGGIFFVVNAATSAMMTFNYEYYWNICCRAPPGPDGIVPVSATKAIIYRALSIIRVGVLALVFGNTLPSAAIVTLAITFSRTAVYVTNDFVWNRIEVQNDWGGKKVAASCIFPQQTQRILPI